MEKVVNHHDRQAMTTHPTVVRSPRSQRGFTLLEIMAALSIIAIVLVSVYRMHAQTISMNYEVRFYTTAPMLAQTKMAEIESKSLEDVGDDSGDFGEQFPNYRWNIVVDDVESSSLGNLAKNLKKIDLLISLNDDEFTYKLRGYKFFKD